MIRALFTGCLIIIMLILSYVAKSIYLDYVNQPVRAPSVGKNLGGTVQNEKQKGKEVDFTSTRVLSMLASEISKDCPLMIDKDTELMTVKGVNGKFTYQYRLVNVTKESTTEDTVYKTMQPILLSYECSNPKTRNFLRRGITMRHEYYDRERNYITALEIKDLDCKSQPTN